MSKHAFKQLKSILQTALILWTPNWNKTILVYCDAFGKTVGITLSQLDENGHDHSIHFASRQLTSIEKKLYCDRTIGFCNYIFFEIFLPLLVKVQGQNCDKS